MAAKSLEQIVALAKRRGFVYPGSEIYGGLANSWDYGPLGVELKNNIKNLWWKMFVTSRDDVVGLDAALIMNPKVWEASGHLAEFSDLLVECKKCHERYRCDTLIEELSNKPFDEALLDFVGEHKESLDRDETWEILRKILTHIPVKGRDEETGKMVEKVIPVDGAIRYLERAHNLDPLAAAYSMLVTKKINCAKCGNSAWSKPKHFNLMFKTFLGPAEEEANAVYLRPETAQAIFVQFKNILQSSRMKPPFGVAQIGKAFRNEITPGNFIFRTREFEQLEIEYFIPEPKSDSDWELHFDAWTNAMWKWIDVLGLNRANVVAVEIGEKDRAFYSKRTIDFEYKYPFGQKELYGLAYRTNYDLAQHEKFSREDLHYKDANTGEDYLPHVIEPSLGVDRSVLAVLLDAYHEEGEGEKRRVVLKLKPALAPYKAAVFPLLKNKPELVAKARGIYEELLKSFPVAWDDRGNIGKRYLSQDEIGTPFCITVDFKTLTDGAVTIRDRDTMAQERIKISELRQTLQTRLS